MKKDKLITIKVNEKQREELKKLAEKKKLKVSQMLLWPYRRILENLR
jgi:hypothetical protein